MVKRIKTWLRKKIGKGGKVVTEELKMDLKTVLAEANDILVTTKKTDLFAQERALINKINAISIKKAEWAVALAKAMEELDKHAKLLAQLTDKFAEFEKSRITEKETQAAAMPEPTRAIGAQQAAAYGEQAERLAELKNARAEAFQAFNLVYMKVLKFRDEFVNFKKKAGKVLNRIEEQKNAAKELTSTIDASWNAYQQTVRKLSKAEKALEKAVFDANAEKEKLAA
ncbi:hypothetical protein GF343_01340 [Candidatus Woesearchaeota archaeon]|nr:hypothetical protein [Candidatus Woesearchaeota archaeon]